MRRYRSLSAAVFVIAVCALVGGFYGRSALAIEDQVPDQYKVFTAALSAIDENYVGTAESDRLIWASISGMLQTLDPHSNFMDPRSYAQMRERQEGRYYGLGITIAVVDGDITVVSLFEGSPAYQKGLRRGDVIAKIEGDATKGWTSDDAVKKLRGPKGTPVKIALKRAGYVVTDVDRDGTLHGPNLDLLRAVCEATDRPIVASGGVGSLSHVHALTELVPLGVEGAIIGKALYAGEFTLAEALVAVEARHNDLGGLDGR